MKTWRNCALKTTSLSNQSAQRCSKEWVSLIFVLVICFSFHGFPMTLNLHKCSMLHICHLYGNMWPVFYCAQPSLSSLSFAKLYKFEGTEGEWFQKLTARFCSHQSWALDQIKNRQKKEPRFNSFILVPAWMWNKNVGDGGGKCFSNADLCCVFHSGGRE